MDNTTKLETANDAAGNPVAYVETKPVREYYSVPACNLPTLLERIAKLNKRCKRLSIPEIGIGIETDYIAYGYQHTGDDWRVSWVPETETEEFEKKQATAANRGARYYQRTNRIMEWHKVEIMGTAPKYDGWHFAATLEPLATDDGTYNMILAVPGETCPGEYVKRVGVCDHCKTNRRRKQTFVVKHENGETRAVGRSCIKDFLGHKSPQTLAAWAEMLAELGSIGDGATDEDWCGMGGGGAPAAWDLEFYLGHATAVCRVRGWCSRGRARDSYGAVMATADVVAHILDPPKMTRTDEIAEHRALVEECTPTDDDKTTSAEIVEWATGLDIDELATGDNDYVLNVAIVARSGVANPKTLGLAASMVVAYKRAMGDEIKRLERLARGPGAHIGEIKKRAEFTLTVKGIFASDGYYGTTLIHKMVDENDNDVVWFCSGGSDFEEGETYRVKATPKAHDEYNGRPQTVVNRVVEVKKVPA